MDGASVDLDSAVDPDYVKTALSAFLQAAIVKGAVADPTTAMYASRSTQGSPVRFLLKVKERSFKVDVKSTNASLAKALSSDIKRLVLIS